MIPIESLFNSPVMQTLGLTLLHFLWQGTLLAVLLVVLLKLLRNMSSNTRYLVSCVVLVFMLVTPVVTWVRLNVTLEDNGAIAESFSFAIQDHSRAANPLDHQKNTVAVLPAAANFLSWRSWLNASLSWMVLAWSIGVAVLFVRLLGGWAETQYCKNRYVTPPDEAIQQSFDGLLDRLEIKDTVRLFQSTRVTVPMVVGWLKPVVLLPMSVLVGLSPSQVTAILAHELAHIRRHDYLINFFQVLVEMVLFYHPAVWWVSRRIRAEREFCCDDMVVSVCGDVANYARALTVLEGFRRERLSWMLAADGGRLVDRIRRMTLPRPPQGHAGMTLGTVTIALILGALAISCTELTVTDDMVMDEAVPLPAHIRDLLDQGDDPGLIEALYAEKDSGNEDALPIVLSAYAYARNNETRGSIVFVIARFFTPEADEQLGIIARNDPDVRVRRNAVKAFGVRIWQLVPYKDPSNVTLQEVWTARIYSERFRGRNKSVYPLFKEIVLDEGEDIRVRRAAISNMMDDGAEELALLEDLYLSVENVSVRGSILGALGRRGKPALPILHAAIYKETEFSNVRSVIWGLGSTGAPQAVPLIADKARSADTEIRATAMIMLRSLAYKQVSGADRAIEELRQEGIE